MHALLKIETLSEYCFCHSAYTISAPSENYNLKCKIFKSYIFVISDSNIDRKLILDSGKFSSGNEKLRYFLFFRKMTLFAKAQKLKQKNCRSESENS